MTDAPDRRLDRSRGFPARDRAALRRGIRSLAGILLAPALILMGTPTAGAQESGGRQEAPEDTGQQDAPTKGGGGTGDDAPPGVSPEEGEASSGEGTGSPEEGITEGHEREEGGGGSPDEESSRLLQILEDVETKLSELDRILFRAADHAEESSRAPEASREALRGIQELLDQAKQAQTAAISGMEELIRSARPSGASSQGSPPPPPGEPQQDEAKRNENDKDQEPTPNPEPSSNQRDPEERARQRQARTPPPQGERGKTFSRDLTGRWGVLPPKVQEIFTNSEAEDFPVRYRTRLRAYYRALNRPRNNP